MSDVPKLGVILDGPQGRDAIHVAINPVIASQTLYPGQHVGFVDGGTQLVGPVPVLIGIIDPFLETRVMKGEQCWLFLYPNTITSLKHVWTHPSFETERVDQSTYHRSTETDVKWLIDFATELGIKYETLMIAAKTFLETGNYYCLNHDYEFLGQHEATEFWLHYERVTGKRVENQPTLFFRCAC